MEPPGEITVETMQQMLREVEQDSTITVLPWLLVNELDKDLHGGGCMSRVTLSYTKGGDSIPHALSLVVKVIPKIPALTEAINKSSVFPREIQMFEKILPRISELLNRSIPDSHEEFFARVYYTRKSPSYLIAIEDLELKGFKAPERKNALDLKCCHLAFKMLARFHAASVIIHKEEEILFDIFDEYSFQEEALQKPLMELGSKISSVVIRTVESWPEFGPCWADRLRKRYETLYDDLHVIWKRKDSGFNVLNHGDFGIHNMMFRYSESGEVESIMLVDFQCCSYNSPVLDLHQFLFSSATDEVRANHTETLLKEYHTELVTTLESLGFPKEQIISLPDLLQEFENKMLYALFYSLVILPLIGFDSDGDLNPDDLFSSANEDINKYDCLVSGLPAMTLRRLLPIFDQKKLI